MIKKLILGFLLLPSFLLIAQNNVLTHIVKPGENITQIANLYKVKTKDILTVNNLDNNSIIKAGQKLLIPMGGYAQKSEPIKSKPSISATPNYHVIEVGESLYKIAKDNNVSVQQLRTWNNLESDNIKAGDYLYFSQQKSTLIKTETKPTSTKEDIVSQSLKNDIKETENQAKVVDKVIENKQNQNQEKITLPTDKSDISAFEKQYKSSDKSDIGLCGTFKTISGWKDKKYYALMNDAVNGSIVKVKLDNKCIYAKVLGPLPNIKEDNNLMIRISNAAAAALGVNYDLFEVKVEQ